MKLIKKIIDPLRIFRNTKGLHGKYLLIGLAYYPIFLIMWYGYYMWKKDLSSFGYKVSVEITQNIGKEKK